MIQEVVWMRRYLVRLQDGLEKEMMLKKITIVVLMSEVEKQIEVRQVEMIPQVCEELS